MVRLAEAVLARARAELVVEALTPEGPNTRAPTRRMASFTSGGAALSAYTHAQTSVLSGPRGCHTRSVRDVGRSIEKFGKTVPTIGLIDFSRGPRRVSSSGPIRSSYSRISGMGGSDLVSRPTTLTPWPLPNESMVPLGSATTRKSPAKPVRIAARWVQGT